MPDAKVMASERGGGGYGNRTMARGLLGVEVIEGMAGRDRRYTEGRCEGGQAGQTEVYEITRNENK